MPGARSGRVWRRSPFGSDRRSSDEAAKHFESRLNDGPNGDPRRRLTLDILAMVEPVFCLPLRSDEDERMAFIENFPLIAVCAFNAVHKDLPDRGAGNRAASPYLVSER